MEDINYEEVKFMKRTIKFRGKCAGTWRYGDHLTYASGEVIKAWMGSISPEYTVEPDTVGQFIGAFDKNGKEIYEGDIVVFVDELNPKKEKPYYVQYDNSCCKFRLYGKDGKKAKAVLACKYYKVIGNVIDNPELLKGE